METVRRKIINKNQFSLLEVIKHNQGDGCIWSFLHRSIIRRLIQDNAGRRTFLTFSKKDLFLDLMILSILRIPHHTNILCKNLRVYEWLDQKWQISCSYPKMTWAKLCFENSSCKCLSFNNTANASWTWQVFALLKFQLCMVCGSNFWIKVKSASEIVYETFNYLVCSQSS